MGLMDWFKALAKGEDKSAHTIASASHVGGIKEDAVVQGLDFVAAIEAHRKWKDRLADYAQGISTEKLDHAVICRDDQCALGKWIYGSGGVFTGHLPLFHQLKAKHAQFHISASEIVEKVQQGRKEEAVDMLLEGEFPKNSRDVQSMLSKLYMDMKGQ